MNGIRGTQRPRSLCDSKLLSVTPHGLHLQQQHIKHNGPLVVKRPPPPLPLVPPRDASKYRGSWPNMIYYGPDQRDTFVKLEHQQRAPSMAGLMNTTVPQRLTRPGLRGGQHTPTRNSLRHSRMICLSQQGKGYFFSYSLDIVCFHRFIVRIICKRVESPSGDVSTKVCRLLLSPFFILQKVLDSIAIPGSFHV